MSRKLEVEKAIWKWTETVKAEQVARIHVETAYRLHLPLCQTGSCRRNCKWSPKCFECLGSAEWSREYEDAQWTDVEDPEQERRKNNSHVGLKNLGATCYVNSLLQLWFHNVRFRRAIYAWKPLDGSDEMNCMELDDDDECRPKSCIGQLQRIFAFLQFSNRRFIDPSSFIKSLGLNTTEQQGGVIVTMCQRLTTPIELYSKTTFQGVNQPIQLQHDPSVRNMIQEEFRGEYAYVTRCCNCGKVSKTRSTFYELDLNVRTNRDLHGCIREFLNEEKLEGSNQYFCNCCRSKENATRSIKLATLPPVLNLQLLRFVFDRQKNQKRKLQTMIKFPEVLDMNQYVDGSNGTLLYDLNAVLLHRGRSAYSGHYVAHIRDGAGGSWFVFNDEDIEKVAGKSLKLVREDDDDRAEDSDVIPKVNGRQTKGHHTSGDAYMLVYHLRKSKSEVSPSGDSNNWVIPYYLQDVVAIDNSKFDEWVSEMKRMRAKNVEIGKEKQVEVLSFFKMLPTLDVKNDWSWIPTKWLIKWLKDDNVVVPAIAISMDRCPHQKLHPDLVVDFKCVTKKAADLLYARYGGEVLPGRQSLCTECVVFRCRYLRLKAKIQEDHKLITEACRVKTIDNSSAFWVGKISFKYWRKLALKQYEDDESNNVRSSKSTNENDRLGDDDCEEVDESTNSEDLLRFNEEIVCLHGKLSIKESSRRLVSQNVWCYFKTYFPLAAEFKESSPLCSHCKDETAEEQHVRETYRKLASEQRSRLSDLYFDRNRPQLGLCDGVSVRYYVVSSDFVNRWRKFIRAPIRLEPVLEVSNKSLLCCHDGLLYRPRLSSSPEMDNNDSSENKYVILSELEWKGICSIFQVDIEISVMVSPSNGPGCFPSLVLSPEFCASCFETRLKEEAKELLVYTHATIFICKISPPDEESSSLAQSSQSGGSGGLHCGVAGDDLLARNTTTITECPSSGTDNSDNLNFNQVVKKKRPNESSYETDTCLRRSTRHRRGQGEKALTVASNRTLRDLKMEIMKHFSVAPFDQHLMLNGKPLVELDATLGQLGIVPGSVIQMRVDEPSDEILNDKATIPEEGFKGFRAGTLTSSAVNKNIGLK